MHVAKCVPFGSFDRGRVTKTLTECTTHGRHGYISSSACQNHFVRDVFLFNWQCYRVDIIIAECTSSLRERERERERERVGEWVSG